MNKEEKLLQIRKKLAAGECSLGSWMQIPNASVAEIMGAAGYDWVALDLEHGAFSLTEMPSICRALELNETLPVARLASGSKTECKQVLDTGIAGLIIPNVENGNQIRNIIDWSNYPTIGTRGVGFSRANMFGAKFDEGFSYDNRPLIVAMIESSNGVKNLEEILAEKVDAIMIGPYDLSCSLGVKADFDSVEFKKCIEEILELCNKFCVPAGLHIVHSTSSSIQRSIATGYQWLACGIDTVFLRDASRLGSVK